MKRELPVSLENKFCYNIIFRFNWDDLADSLIEISHGKPRKIAVVTDSNVAPLYLRQVYEAIGSKFNEVITFQLPAGEKSKTLDNVQKLYEVLINKNFYRGDLLVALGGGVIGDLTGYTAATYLRGIDFVQIPTTLLSQVDSSIGGKTGVDFKEYKNMVGAFHMPKLVYLNTTLLNSLPDDQFSSGMAEVIKHGIIRNREYFDWLLENRSGILNKNPEMLLHMVYESCLVKRDVVQEDPTEKGIRAILNFGHTIGHAIEKLSNFSLSHGECVALGSVCAAGISNRLGLIENDDMNLITDVLKSYGLPVSTDMADPDRVIETTRSDKKMTSRGIKFVLIDKIGNAFVKEGLDEDIMRDSLKEIGLG